MNTHSLDYPALDGRTVTEAHARYCRENGHATHTTDGQTDTVCPRCGDSTTTPKRINKAMERRTKAIEDLAAHWVHQDGASIGNLRHLGSFVDLYQDVEKLRELGRSDAWQEGITKWQETIQIGINRFAFDNGFTYQIASGAVSGEFTVQTGTEHARLITWAVMQGTVWVSNI